MKTISQYKADIKTLMDKADAMDTNAQNEGRDLTNNEVNLQREILDTIEEINKSVKILERKERIATMLDTSDERLTVPDDARLDVSAPNSSKDRFASFGQQLIAVVNAGKAGGSIDPKLFNAAASGLNETTSADGGFLVQQDFVTELIVGVETEAVLAPKCRMQPISGNANSIKILGVDETSRVDGSRQGGVQVYMADETEQATASKPNFRKIELNLNKMMGVCYATDELLTDAAALEGFIRNAFPAEIAFKKDDLILRGTGAGQNLGILNAGCLVTQAKETGQTKDTILAENVINMSSRIFAKSFSNANWYINQMCLPQLHTMSIAIGTGGQLVYMPPGGLSGSLYGTLLGRPVIPIEQASALGDVGDILLADMNGYILAEKGGIKSDVSVHVRFLYDEQVFKFTLRIDGQPLRASALTPYKGGVTATQSHFVTLAARE